MAATCSAASVRRATGRTAPRDTNQATAPATSTALPPIRNSRIRSPLSTTSVSVTSRATCTAAAPSSPVAGVVSMR